MPDRNALAKLWIADHVYHHFERPIVNDALSRLDALVADNIIIRGHDRYVGHLSQRVRRHTGLLKIHRRVIDLVEDDRDSGRNPDIKCLAAIAGDDFSP